MNPPDFAAGAAFVDGRFVPIDQARISVLDWGFTRSDVVYDVAHVVDGSFFRLQAHLDRFARSMAARRLDIGMPEADLRRTLHRVVALAGLRDAYVAMAALRGRPRIAGSRRPEDCGNHLVAYALPWIDVLPKAVQARGARLWIADIPRVPDASVDPTVKNYQWSDLTTGLLQAHDQGHDSTVLCDADGYVTEGPGFNVFVVRDGQVATADRGALHGITRDTVLALCDELGIPASVAPLRRDALTDADEVFVTTTAGGVMRIAAINGVAVRHADVHPVTARLQQAYRDAHHRPAYTEAVDYGVPA